MAGRRLSSLLSRSLASSPALLSKGRRPLGGTTTGKYSTSAAVETPITPSVKVNYTQLLINGQFLDSISGKTFPTFDPRTGEVIANVAEGDAKDVDLAVSAARKAFDEGPWPRMTAYERSKIILRFADLVEKNAEEIAALETWDNGKTYEQSAKLEVPMFVRIFRYYAGWADKIHGLTVPADGSYNVQTLHEPIGVAGQIIPWNFPLLMFAWKVGPALACGNTIVLKTAEQTPLSALYVAKLLHEAGLPEGVLNIVSGYGPTAGAALASHMEVDKLAFTGSTETGKVVLELAAKSNLKPVTLELGGKSPFIVCEDADVDKAVEMAHFALFFNQGQCCCAGSRTFVHEKVYDEFIEKARKRAVNRVVGDPFLGGIEQGPQVDGEQFKKILRYIKSGIEGGATLEAGGERFGSKGYYVQPTVFSNVKDDMTIAREEIFGPVQTILKYKEIEEVISQICNHNFISISNPFFQFQIRRPSDEETTMAAAGGTEAFPDLGRHCQHSDCHQLDFLPFTCDGCQKVFCLEHRGFKSHDCPKSNRNSRKVVVCEICSMSIETTGKDGSDESRILERHHESGDCDPRKKKKPTCSARRCREILTFSNTCVCKTCRLKVCLKHRFPAEHNCGRVDTGRWNEKFMAALELRSGGDCGKRGRPTAANGSSPSVKAC